MQQKFLHAYRLMPEMLAMISRVANLKVAPVGDSRSFPGRRPRGRLGCCLRAAGPQEHLGQLAHA
jgi:hypothetical protein